jgi:hypothetical protein
MEPTLKQRMKISKILNEVSEGPDMFDATMKAIRKGDEHMLSAIYSQTNEGPDLYIKVRKVLRK